MTEPTRDADPDLDRPVAEQVAELLTQLTRTEKIALLHQYQAAVPRLGIAAFRTGTEALHGLAGLGPATVFPQAVGLASGWDLELMRSVGAAVGDEVRGFHHKDPARGGLNVWAPVVNPLRDPRWGRNEEGYSEDPWLTGLMGAAYAAGLRGDHPRYLKTAPTLKHFLGYNNETDRDISDSNLSPRVRHEYEFPAFRPALEQDAAVAVMASYNLVNGRPAHLSRYLREELRRWARGQVLVVSDAQAPSNLVDVQGSHTDHAASHAAAMRAGIDSFTDHDTVSGVTIGRITEALDRGLLTEEDVDHAVRRILTLRCRLGEFVSARDNPYARITADVINCSAHQELACQAARRSLVLLRNDGILPLRPCSVAVIGPLADTVHTDWYSGTLPYAVTARVGLAERLGAGAVRWCEGVDRVALRLVGTDDYLTASDDPHGGVVRTGGFSPAAELDLFDWGGGQFAMRAGANGQHLRIDQGGQLVNDSPGPNGWVVRETLRLVEQVEGAVALWHPAVGRYLTVEADGVARATAADLEAATGFAVELVRGGAASAAAAAAAADVALVVLGNHPMVNGRETEDRSGLELPGAQETLLRAVRAANPRTVLVLCSSYPYAIEWADQHLPAILWSAHGGQEYGRALAEVLLGAAEPAGRLTQTWYRSAADLPDLFDYDIIASDATYLYYRGTPLYPFGHGGSYTTFEFENLQLSQDEVEPTGKVTVSLDVLNTGDRAGEEVVQLYTRQLGSRVKQPVRALRGFARVQLEPGQRTSVRIDLPTAALAFWDVTAGRMVVEAARHRIMVGRSATDIRLSAILAVRGEHIPPRDPTGLSGASYDDCCGVVLRDAGPVGDVVTAAEPGAWIEFREVDFTRVPGRARLRVAHAAGGPVGLTLRRDDPLTGTVLGTCSVPVTGDRDTFAELVMPVSAVTGVVDLYVIFAEPGPVLAALCLEPVP